MIHTTAHIISKTSMAVRKMQIRETQIRMEAKIIISMDKVTDSRHRIMDSSIRDIISRITSME